MELEWIQKRRNRKGSHYISDRKTECGEIEDTLRKNPRPSPTNYNPNDTFTKQKKSACYQFLDQRLGYIDEALLLGELWPA